ncbi:hypothetical protein ABE060_18920 [Bacillus rugosus]|uniref:DUF3955 domain-containing protein n=1 Tax=Bacillus subtilis TaxID=1423 RepID=A0A1J0AKV2_BACIU|nr:MULTISPECIES: hypothetical protein [Bacillus]APB62371.1 hypothetical protein pBS72_1020 [Bacillus subtilis]MEC3664996.1 hypothetical protein [Bacillus subtilis]NUF07833.1 hypothetical protein [Bacillus rugosus]
MYKTFIALFVLFCTGFISFGLYSYATNLGGIRDTVNNVFSWLSGPFIGMGIVFVIVGIPALVLIARNRLEDEKKI